MNNAEINLEYNLESLLPAVCLEDIHKFEKKYQTILNKKLNYRMN